MDNCFKLDYLKLFEATKNNMLPSMSSTLWWKDRNLCVLSFYHQ